jgi:hypothetical protein
MARQNEKVNKFITDVEFNYAKFNQQLANLEIRQALLSIGRVFGFLSIIIAVILFFLQPLIARNSTSYFWIYYFLIAFILQWISIRWCLRHKEQLNESKRTVALFVFAPLIVGVLEYYSGVSLTEPIRLVFADTIPIQFISEFARSSGPIYFGLAITLFMGVGFSIHYLMMWIITLPIVLFSIFLIMLAVKFARFVNLIAPKIPFQGFLICAFVIVSISTLEVWQQINW